MQTTGRPLGRADGAAAEAALAGAPVARRLLRELAAPGDTARAVRVDVVGAGGTGKTVLLDALAGVLAATGRTVHRAVPDEPGADDALVVDDVHALDPAALARLRAALDGPAGAVVVARRPWPHPPDLAAVTARIDAVRGPVALGPLDAAGVGARVAHLTRERPTAALVDLVATQTAGHPGLVDRMIRTLRERGTLDGTSAPEVTTALVQHLVTRVDALPGGPRDLLLALAAGAPPDPEVLAPVAQVPPEAVAELVAQTEATGLLPPGRELAPLVRQAVLRAAPAVTRIAVRRRIGEALSAQGASVLAAARGLLGTGATGPRAAAMFVEAGDEALRDCLPVAAELYAAGVAAGAAGPPLSARRAEAALLAGDVEGALAHADRVLAEPGRAEPGDVVRAGTVAAAGLAHRGLLARSAELYRWLATETGGTTAVLAVPALVGAGEIEEAGRVLAAADRQPAPTLQAGAAELLARGVRDSVTGAPGAALSQLARSVALLGPSGRAALLPDTPVAIGALVAMHCGELDVAQSLVERAVSARLGGQAVAARHRLLQGWILMHKGATAAARAVLAALPAERLEPRDELVAAALDVALARRTADLAALLTAWTRAREAIVRQPVDLYSLQALGELVVGAARLREEPWVAPHVAEARGLLTRLGEPPLWAAPLYWAQLQAALVADAAEPARAHAAALDRLAPAGRYPAALAAGARAWLRVLAGDVDAEGTEAAARGLHAVGLAWEGGRLAGQAAIRTPDRRDMTALLGCARALQAGVAGPAAAAPPPPARADGEPGPTPEPAAPEPVFDAPPGQLSDREREVAELVLAGMTYKQIGEQLFISAKTVEHHVARMRQRLGSESRGELFARLRMLVGTPS